MLLSGTLASFSLYFIFIIPFIFVYFLLTITYILPSFPPSLLPFPRAISYLQLSSPSPLPPFSLLCLPLHSTPLLPLFPWGQENNTMPHHTKKFIHEVINSSTSLLQFCNISVLNWKRWQTNANKLTNLYSFVTFQVKLCKNKVKGPAEE